MPAATRPAPEASRAIDRGRRRRRRRTDVRDQPLCARGRPERCPLPGPVAAAPVAAV